MGGLCAICQRFQGDIEKIYLDDFMFAYICSECNPKLAKYYLVDDVKGYSISGSVQHIDSVFDCEMYGCEK